MSEEGRKSQKSRAGVRGEEEMKGGEREEDEGGGMECDRR